MKVYIAIKLNKDKAPEILGVFRKKEDAEHVAYNCNGWGNVKEEVVK